MAMTTNIRKAGGVTIVDIAGRIVIGEESAALRDLVRELLTKGIDSTGLGLLVSAFTSVRNLGGELKLFHLTNKVQGVLQITKLYTVFDILNDEAAGVEAFGQSTAATGQRRI